MFDSIYFNCECGQSIEAQSKGGKCTLAVYDHDSVPKDVAEDANRHAPFKCHKCDKMYKFADEEIEPQRVSLKVVRL